MNCSFIFLLLAVSKKLKQRNPILYEFLVKEKETKERILHNLEKESGNHILIRVEEIRKELEWTKEALAVYL